MFINYADTQKYGRRAPSKRMVKKGTVKIGVVETTPVVFNDRLLRFEWIRSDKWGKPQNAGRTEGYYHFVDMETEEVVGKPFAFSHAFGCAYSENGVMYAHGVGGNGDPCNYIDVFVSSDLENWTSQRAITLDPSLSVFNTSVCKDDTGYLMAIEVDGPREVVGQRYTVIFAHSNDLLNWELMPIDKYIFYKERYSASPSVRYVDGMYYIAYLEVLPFATYTPYIVRSSDLISFEVAMGNPFMMYDDDDKMIINPERFSAEQIDYITHAINCNNSDIDFCEYHGKTHIVYSWGNQRGTEFLALAEFDGSLEEFLKSYFEMA